MFISRLDRCCVDPGLAAAVDAIGLLETNDSVHVVTTLDDVYITFENDRYRVMALGKHISTTIDTDDPVGSILDFIRKSDVKRGFGHVDIVMRVSLGTEVRYDMELKPSEKYAHLNFISRVFAIKKDVEDACAVTKIATLQRKGLGSDLIRKIFTGYGDMLNVCI